LRYVQDVVFALCTRRRICAMYKTSSLRYVHDVVYHDQLKLLLVTGISVYRHVRKTFKDR